MNPYWLKIGLGLIVVSIPFLVAAFQKKIPWLFFWSWTLTSIFATLVFILIQNSIETNLDPRTKLIISIFLGLMSCGIGLYMRTIQSMQIRKLSWLFTIFGVLWILLSFIQ